MASAENFTPQDKTDPVRLGHQICALGPPCRQTLREYPSPSRGLLTDFAL
jgi:hypothetical protein